MRNKALVLSFLLFAAVSWAESSLDKMVGTWKYAPEKAVPPDENIASEVIKIEKVGPNTIRQETEQVMKSGKKQSMTTTQVAGLTTSAIAVLTTTDIQALSPAQIGVLNTTQIAALTTVQVGSFSTTQIGVDGK